MLRTRAADRLGPPRHTEFHWFLAARGASLLGNAMAPVAVAFAILQFDPQPSALGAILAARSLPLVVFLLVGGVVADRLPRIPVLLAANLGAGATQLVAACLLISDNYHHSALLMLEFINGTLTAFATPAARGALPQMIEPAARQQANSLMATVKNVSTIGGPALAGLLVAGIGGGWTIAVDAACSLAAASCLCRVRQRGGGDSTGTSVLGDLRVGWTHFRRRTWLWATVVAFSALNGIYVGLWTVAGPVVARRSLGVAAWGQVLGLNAAGLLVASILMYRWRLTYLLRWAVLCIAMLGPLPLLALGVRPTFTILAVAAVAGGVGFGIFGTAWETVLQEQIPGSVLSRVASFDDAGSYLMIPIGQIMAGVVVADRQSATYIAAGGVLYLVCGALLLTFPSVRNLARQHPTADSASIRLPAFQRHSDVSKSG
ncbi:MFS transporter [Nocardia sp. KC 131]|uniref:MFS transporter n=1 Tax=Nocardia arseniciresistens TaxID=3392119 RepID=UPI00398EEB6C